MIDDEKYATSLDQLVSAVQARLDRVGSQFGEDRVIEELTAALCVLKPLFREQTFIALETLLEMHRERRDRALEGRSLRQGRKQTDRELVALALAEFLAGPNPNHKALGQARRKAEEILGLAQGSIVRFRKKHFRASRANGAASGISRGAIDAESRIAAHREMIAQAVHLNGQPVEIFAPVYFSTPG